MTVVTLLICLTIAYLSTFLGLLFFSSNEDALSFLSHLGGSLEAIGNQLSFLLFHFLYFIGNEPPLWIENGYVEKLFALIIKFILDLIRSLVEIFFSVQMFLSLFVCFLCYEILYEYEKLKEMVSFVYFPVHMTIAAFWNFVTNSREFISVSSVIFMFIILWKKE
jgi:hypothetical protein